MMLKINTKRTQRGYAMGLFVMILMVLSSLVVASFMVTTRGLAESQRQSTNAQTRALAQDALSRFYAEFTANEEFREQVLAFDYDNEAFRTLDNVANSLFDPATDTCSVEEDLCVRVSVAMSFYGDAGTSPVDENGQTVTSSLMGQALARLAREGNSAALPQGLAVRADVAGNCTPADGQETIAPERCDNFGTFTQRVVPSQFYEYAFYNQFSTLDPDAYPNAPGADVNGYRNAAKSICANRYAERVNDRYAGGDDSPGTSDAPGGVGLLPRSQSQAASGTECLDVAYQSDSLDLTRGDLIDGPLFSNDDFILICNNPQFKQEVFVNPALTMGTDAEGQSFLHSWRSVGAAPYLFEGCAENPSPEFSNKDAGDPDPDSFEYLDTFETFMPENANYTELAESLAALTPPAVNIVNGATTPAAAVPTITLSAQTDGTTPYTQYSVNGSTPVKLDKAFLYIRGDANIQGDAVGAISVYASGNLTISGDIRRMSVNDLAFCTTPTSTGPDVELSDAELNCGTAIGLAAGESIVVSQKADPEADGIPNVVTTNPTDHQADKRIVQAILISLNGSVRTPGWSDFTWQADRAPTLEFYGAIASKYQGVYGGYEQITGNLVSGYRKDFRFDRRLAENEVSVPFLPSPISGNWTRLDFSEVPANL